MPISLARASASALACLVSTAAVSTQSSVPIAVDVSIDTSTLGVTGSATAEFTFTVREAVDAAFGVRLELHGPDGRFLRRDHGPKTPTSQWAEGATVRYAIPLTFATDPKLPDEPGNVIAWVGFLDPADGAVRSSSGARRNRDGLVFAGRFDFPTATPSIDDAAVEQAIEAARKASRGGEHAEAWNRLEYAFRRTPDYGHKAALRDALMEVAKHAPPPLSFEEEAIVAERIRGERERYLRQVSGRMFDRGQLHGALALLEEIGGQLAEAADAAVIGALDDAQRTQKSIDDVREKIFAPTQQEEREIEALRSEHGETKALLKQAQSLMKRDNGRRIARELLRRLAHSRDDEIGPPAKADKERVEATMLAAVPPAESAAVAAALGHACWGRTENSVSHRFVFIGPEGLVQGIPDDSRLAFDLAYLYLTDLFGRVPNPGGDRVTVYFKELWEFGGGVGGGKRIDIGRANPSAKKTQVDTSLLFHELTHCVDDTRPIFSGLREGLADFGAAFVQHELGRRGPARAAFGLAKRAFEADYLQRDLEYWRIPNYAPSAGLLLHFVQAHGKAAGGGYQWERYRRFFRNYRTCPIQDERTPQIARAFAYHLAQAFGEKAFEDLIEFRWPLVPEDLEALATEFELAGTGWSVAGRALDGHPNSPVPRDRAAALVLGRSGRDAARDDLGVVFDWRVIGPFKQAGVDADKFAFPPEYEVDFEARYAVPENTAVWRVPRGRPPVIQHDTGWLEYRFPYMDNTAIYALTHAEVDADTTAWLHLRADDDLTVFVNDELVGKYAFSRSTRLGPWRPRAAVKAPDAVRFRVTLNKGRNKILVKVRNGRGASGLSMAIAERNGMPLDVPVRTDNDPPEKKSARLGDSGSKAWKKAFGLRFSRSSAARKLDVTVGKFKVQQKRLRGIDTGKGVGWRKYTVRPGFPKDSPSNLAWLPAKQTADLEDFVLELGVTTDGGDAPKLCVIFQGDGGRDGLGGHALVLLPRGKDAVQARLERYDRLVMQSDRVRFAPEDPDEPTLLTIELFADRLTVRLGAETLFEQVSVRRIPGRDRLGIATWGPKVHLTELELRAPRKTR